MSGTSSETFSDKAKRAALNRWKLETWTKMLGVRGLDRAQRESEKNQQAENRAVRRQLWGSEETGEGDGDDMGGHTYLGDVTTPAPIVVAGGGGGNNLGPLLAAALGMLGPAGVVGGYVFNQVMQQKGSQPAPAPVVQPGENTTIIERENLDMRLLQVEDLLPAR